MAPKSDILCDIKIIKVEVVGDQAAIDQILEEKTKPRTFAEVKDIVEEVRVRATDFFSKKSIDNAVKLYQRIIQTVQFAETADEKEKKDKEGILVRVMTNLAVCKSKQEDWQQALDYVNMIEASGSIDTNPKVLFTKGRALMKLGDIEEALVFLVKALKLRSDDKQIIQAIEECQKRKEKYYSFNKNFAKNLKLA